MKEERRRRSDARKKALKKKWKGCVISGSHDHLEGHHIYKWAVFKEKEGFDEIVWLTRENHRELEELIRTRENDVLRNKPELYLKAWEDFKRLKENERRQADEAYRMGRKAEATKLVY